MTVESKYKVGDQFAIRRGYGSEWCEYLELENIMTKSCSEKPTTKEPVELLMRLLVNGGRVQQDGFEFAMSEDGGLCFVDSRGVGHEMPCDLVAFKKMADDIGRDELWLRCCALQLAR